MTFPFPIFGPNVEIKQPSVALRARVYATGKNKTVTASFPGTIDAPNTRQVVLCFVGAQSRSNATAPPVPTMTAKLNGVTMKFLRKTIAKTTTYTGGATLWYHCQILSGTASSAAVQSIVMSEVYAGYAYIFDCTNVVAETLAKAADSVGAGARSLSLACPANAVAIATSIRDSQYPDKGTSWRNLIATSSNFAATNQDTGVAGTKLFGTTPLAQASTAALTVAIFGKRSIS